MFGRIPMLIVIPLLIRIKPARVVEGFVLLTQGAPTQERGHQQTTKNSQHKASLCVGVTSRATKYRLSGDGSAALESARDPRVLATARPCRWPQ